MEQIKRDIENENIDRLSRKVRIQSGANIRYLYPNGNYTNTKIFREPRESLITRRRNIITPYIHQDGTVSTKFKDISETFSEKQLANRIARTPKYPIYYYDTDANGRVINVFRPKQLNANKKKTLPKGTLNEIFK